LAGTPTEAVDQRISSIEESGNHFFQESLPTDIKFINWLLPRKPGKIPIAIGKRSGFP
jgi:hypothetical protein